MIWTLEKLRSRREDILAIAHRHGARSIRVIGSVSRGDATEESDLDFVASFEEGRSLMDLGELIMDLEDALSTKVDVISEKALRPRFRATVEAEAAPL